MKVHNGIRLAAAFAAASLSLAACSASGTNPLTPTQDKLPTDILKMSVGTANIYGDLGGAAGGTTVGLNVVASYRQPSGALKAGDSAVLVSTPSLTGPFKLPAAAGAGAGFDPTSSILFGPGTSEVGTNRMGASAQGASGVLTTFGTSGGVFQTGIEPFNYTNGGTPTTNVPYPVPVYDAAAGSSTGDPNQLPAAWGGPPAFDVLGTGLSPVGSGLVPAGEAGVSEALDVFSGVAPATGVYTLSVTVPANTGAFTATTTAGLSSSTLLPAVAPAAATFDTAGGGTFVTALPAPITEAYVQIVDVGLSAAAIAANPSAGTCNGSPGATGGSLIYYTLAVTSGAPTGTLPDAIGPGGTPSLCTAAQNAAANGGTDVGADQVLVQTYAFDYPMYENTQSRTTQSMNPSPTFAGANGQSDISVSSVAAYTQTTTTSSRVRSRPSRALLKSLMRRHR